MTCFINIKQTAALFVIGLFAFFNLLNISCQGEPKTENQCDEPPGSNQVYAFDSQGDRSVYETGKGESIEQPAAESGGKVHASGIAAEANGQVPTGGIAVREADGQLPARLLAAGKGWLETAAWGEDGTETGGKVPEGSEAGAAGAMFHERNLLHKEHDRDYFRLPVTIPAYLSGNFGAIRSNSFHAGIDIRTGGRTGEKVVAAAEGYVYRIVVSPTGYGRALYVQHPGGLATVYAHLDEFTEEIEEYVTNEQYRRESFAVDLHPPRGKFRFQKGEFIAYSGNTGSSSGPHLHFEIREGATQMPVNPLLFNFNIRDNLPPEMYLLAIYPMDKHSRVNGSREPAFFPVRGGDGRFRLNTHEPPEVSGRIGFGIKAYDYMDGTRFRQGIHSVGLEVDGNSVYRHDINSFSYSETRYVNSLIDYKERVKNNRNIKRLFIDPNNNLNIYAENKDRGIVTFDRGEEVPVEVSLKDAHGNSSLLSFTVNPVEQTGNTSKPDVPENFKTLMRHDSQNRFTNDSVRVSLPQGALYDDLLFEYKNSSPVEDGIGDVHHIHNRYTPVHLNYELSLRADGLPGELREKALIVNVRENENGEVNVSSAGGSFSNGYVTTRTNRFGKFTVMVDTVAPKIEPVNIWDNRDMSGKDEIRIKISDELSGIASYNGYIDGRWVLFEYDAKNDLLFYEFDPKRIGRDKDRELELRVADRKGNTSVYRTEFYY